MTNQNYPFGVSVMQRLLRNLFFTLHAYLRGLGNRVLDKKNLFPRNFSNFMLKYYAPFFSGHIINVSGWEDKDREGKNYEDYFTGKTEYTVSNAPGKQKGLGSIQSSGQKEIEIDLNNPLPPQLNQKFDTVFNHTTLEHIFNVEQAFKNICELSRDAVIIIIPVIQNFHIKESYGDYWRMTPLAIARSFLKNGFVPMVIVTNDQPFVPIYCFAIGVRDPSKYAGKIEKKLIFDFGYYLYGSKAREDVANNLLKN